MVKVKFKIQKHHLYALTILIFTVALIAFSLNPTGAPQKKQPVCRVERKVVGRGVVWVVPASYGCNDSVKVYARAGEGWVLDRIVVGGRVVGNGSSFVVDGNVTVRAVFARLCRLRVVGEPFPGRVAVNGSVYDLPFESWYRCGSRLYVVGVGRLATQNSPDMRLVPLSEPVNVTLDSDKTVKVRFGLAYRVRVENPSGGLPARIEYVLAGRERSVELPVNSSVEVWVDDGSVLRIVSDAPERVGEKTVLYLGKVVKSYRVATVNGTQIVEEKVRVEEGEETSTAEVEVTMPLNLTLKYTEGLYIPPDYKWTGKVVVNGTPANITVIPLEKNIGTGAVHFTGRFIALPNGTMVLSGDPDGGVYIKMPEWHKLVIKGWIMQRETKGAMFKFFVTKINEKKSGFRGETVYSDVLKAYYRYRFEIVVERLGDDYRNIKITAKFLNGECFSYPVVYVNGQPQYETVCPEFNRGEAFSFEPIRWLDEGDLYIYVDNSIVRFTIYVYP